MSDDTGSPQRLRDRAGSGYGPWWFASGVIVVAVIVGLGYVLLAPSPQQSGTGSPATAVTSNTKGAITAPTDITPSTSGGSTVGGAQAAAWSDTGCNGTRGDTDIPTSAPSGVTWQPLGGISVPTSPTLGPRRVQAPLRECFQHSPAGALMAINNIFAAFLQAPTSADLIEVLQQQMTPGPQRDTYITQARGDDGGTKGDATASSAGFQFGACTPARCLVNIAQVSSGYYALNSTALVWSDGDWRMDGTVALSGTGSSTLPGGYLPFQPGV